jgi:hypothetical protein
MILASNLTYFETVTIASGQSLSDAINVSTRTVVGVVIPTWTSAAASFEVSYDGSEYFRVKEVDGDEYSLVAGTGNAFFSIAPTVLLGAHSLKIRSGTGASPVAQAAARSIKVVLKEL